MPQDVAVGLGGRGDAEQVGDGGGNVDQADGLIAAKALLDAGPMLNTTTT